MKADLQCWYCVGEGVILIKERMCKSCILLVALAAFSSLLHADSRQEAWYQTVDGQYTVRETLHGSFYASLGMTKREEVNVYFEVYAPEHCRENGERVIGHDPVYINGTLVKMSQHCRGDWNLFFATTEAGSDYVIRQFRKSRSIELKTLEGTVLIFSAMGFVDYYSKMLVRQEAL